MILKSCILIFIGMNTSVECEERSAGVVLDFVLKYCNTSHTEIEIHVCLEQNGKHSFLTIESDAAQKVDRLQLKRCPFR